MSNHIFSVNFHRFTFKSDSSNSIIFCVTLPEKFHNFHSQITSSIHFLNFGTLTNADGPSLAHAIVALECTP
jgi:hypothetical protein